MPSGGDGGEDLFVRRELGLLFLSSLAVPEVMLVVAGPAPHLFHFLLNHCNHGVIRQPRATSAMVVNNISQSMDFHILSPLAGVIVE